MQVKLADDYGFCNGVKASIAMAEANPGSTIVGGEIIHNPEETARLERDFGVRIEEDANAVAPCSTAIIRAHGIAEATEKGLLGRGVKLLDATCPNVKKIQNMVKALDGDGYRIILSGDRKHPEVQGIMSYARQEIMVVKDEEELNSVKLSGKVAVLSQTTKDYRNFARISSWATTQMNNDVSECRLCNTICSATAKKQIAAEKIAAETDIVVVVGGKNSSNTKSLADIAGNHCETHLVERAEELDPSWFKGKGVCGLTAGSSTPDYSVRAVQAAIEKIR